LAGSVGTHWIEGANGFNHHAGTSIDGPMPTVQAGRPVRVIDETPHVLIAPSRRNGNGFNYQHVDPDAPCGTVTTASPGNDLGVPSSVGRRKFTIAELKRICAFPDDFILMGSYAQQWARLGNAVPPIMMKMIAESIRDHIFHYAEETY
jgi:site-specific DNA-cytosine methylase